MSRPLTLMRLRCYILSLFALTTVCLQATPAETEVADSTLHTDSLTSERDSVNAFLFIDTALDELIATWTCEFAAADSTCTATTDVEPCTDEQYAMRLQAIPSIIDMPFNQHVKAAIEAYIGRHSRQSGYLIGMANYYLTYVEQKLDQYGLPIELRVLPIIESAYNSRAISYAGAAGLWQFMATTGRIYNMEMNSLIDERLDPYKSTDAACRLLASLYRIYNDWPLALAAYNCGPGTINKAIARSGGKRNVWALYPYLPKQTRNYIPAFVAANYLINYYDMHGICPIHVNMPAASDTIMVDKRLNLDKVALLMGVDMETLRILNPQYKRGIIPGGKPYSLCLPADVAVRFASVQDEIYSSRADSIVALASDSALTAMGITPPRNKATSSGTKYSKSGNSSLYTVRKGDTLSGIAKRYGVTVKQLRTWNHCSDKLKIGQKIRINK